MHQVTTGGPGDGGAAGTIGMVKNGERVLLDVGAGELILEVDEQTVQSFQQSQEERRQKIRKTLTDLAKALKEPA